MKKILIFCLLIGYTALGQGNSKLHISFGPITSLVHNTRFQSLMQSQEIKKTGVLNGFFGGIMSEFNIGYIKANVSSEAYSAISSNYIHKDLPIKLRGYEVGGGINLFPNWKLLNIYAGAEYNFYAMGSVEIGDASSNETIFLPAFISSTKMNFPAFNLLIKSNRDAMLNIYLEGSQPMEVNYKTFSKVKLGVLLSIPSAN